MNAAALQSAIESAYSDLYDDPRPISYWEIGREYDTDSLGETDLIADVIDLACRDAERDRDPRDVDGILEYLDPEVANA